LVTNGTLTRLLRYHGDVPDALGLRERKKLRTQQQLQQAALELFLEHGFDNVTTDDIAAAVEVSKTTFYRYFESKEDVLLGNTAERLASIRQALDDRPVDEPVLVAVRHAMTSVIGHYDQARDAALLKARVMRDSRSLKARNLEQQAAWESVVADFVRSRLPNSSQRELQSRVIAANVIASLRATIDYWLDTQGRDQLAALVDDVLDRLEPQHA
jgi:AcrR family transcriptional regulator